VVAKVAPRLGAVAATPENAQALLAQGRLVAVFPEGSLAGEKPWGDRYRLQHFGRGGFAKVALRAGTPIVPCAIVGSEEATPPASRSGWLAERLRLPLLAMAPRIPLGPLAFLPLPSRWTIRFGDPVATAGRGVPTDAAAVAALAEEARSALQRMLDEDVAARRSVFI
jgi:1-acyl-sn-glycerol-3-phosphate acyltransferase